MLRLRLKRVLAITLGWMAVGVVVSVYDHLNFLVFQQYADLYAFPQALLSNITGGLLGGLLGATVIVFYLKRTDPQRSFLAAIGLHTLVAGAVIALVALVVSVGFQSIVGQLPPTDPNVLRAALGFLSSAANGKIMLFWFIVTGMTSLFLEISDKYGPTVLRNFVLGRYHRPRVEERCFMFLDMRSSTAIAERLGHSEYFALLRMCFADMTEAIVDARGEIYQYVGDEVVVTWPLEKGVADGNCVRCFYLIRSTLDRRAVQYVTRFGTVPMFKAGVHAGQVTTGEVGTLRKDIVFTGDVLNTAARIQERCNVLGRDLLVSDALLERLPETLRRGAVEVERIALRGQTDPITIHALLDVEGQDSATGSGGKR